MSTTIHNHRSLSTTTNNHPQLPTTTKSLAKTLWKFQVYNLTKQVAADVLDCILNRNFQGLYTLTEVFREKHTFKKQRKSQQTEL